MNEASFVAVDNIHTLGGHPLVSIIMPAYNASSTIREAIDSVLRQSWSNWELIVVNDGSSDDTLSVAQSYADSRIVVFDQENQGVSAARNRALDFARGEFICFLDADDCLPVQSLELRAELLMTHTVADFSDGVVYVLDFSQKRLLRIYSPTASSQLLPRLLRLDQQAFFGISYMIRRAAIGSIRFNSAFTHCEDLLFFAAVAARRQSRAVVTDKLIYEYRFSVTSAMGNASGLCAGYAHFFKRASVWQSQCFFDYWIGKLRASKVAILVCLRRRKPVQSVIWAARILFA